MANKFYLTTPIYYVNARPHIGHAYSTIAADVIARRHRLLGEDVFFLTGTDEHGQKVQRSAAAAGVPPQQFTDEVSASFSNLWKRMGITNDDFIRTTDPRHKRGVQKLWQDLEARGAIYLSTYTGQYSVGEEMFVDGPPGTLGPDGKPTETVTEENYFFRLSDYQQPILDLIESNTLHIQPDTVRNEVLSFLRSGLKDLSISRTTFDWGIPVPTPKAVILNAVKDPCISAEAPQSLTQPHVVYVWLDALTNYLTAIGYGSDDPADIAKFAKYWPADLHLVGKEITRFHCVYWPAFLLAAGLPLPKSVVANGWLLFEESKMSKSRGNVVRTETILDAFGPLCPPPPTPLSPPPTLSSRSAAEGSAVRLGAPKKNEAVILSAAKDPETANAATSDRPFQPPNSAALAPPTKPHQDLFAADVLRYYLLREIPFGQDGSFSFDALITRYNADLANGYGNLVSRTLSLIQQNFRNGIDRNSQTKLEGTSFVREGVTQLNRYAPSFGESGITAFITETSLLVGHVDRYISSHTPWKLANEPGDAARQQLVEVLYTAAESIRLLTAHLYPFIPYATASVWAQLGLGDIEQAAKNGDLKNLQWGGLQPGTKLGSLSPIFPRADKGLAQIMTDLESPTTPTPEPTVSPTDNQQPATGNPITIDDFTRIDLRVAQIVVAERIPKADKLLRLEVDLGPDQPRRQILSGIAEWYTPEELIGRRVAIIANLAPRKMRGLESHGMLLAASADTPAGKPILATFSDEVPLGSRIK
jgi:methionyl-tRNA synthetase